MFRPSGELGKDGEGTTPLLNGNQNRTLFPSAPDSIIVHPGAVICILDLIPAISFSDPTVTNRSYFSLISAKIMQNRFRNWNGYDLSEERRKHFIRY